MTGERTGRESYMPEPQGFAASLLLTARRLLGEEMTSRF